MGRALRALLITLLLGTWLDPGAWAAIRHADPDHCSGMGEATHHDGLALAPSDHGSRDDCRGGSCQMIRHCSGSVNGAFVLAAAAASSAAPAFHAGLPIGSLTVPRTRYIAPPTPPPLSPLDVTA